MATKLGTPESCERLCINKLYQQERFGGSHVPVDFLSQGYPPRWRHLVKDAIDALEREGIIQIEVKRTGMDSAPCYALQEPIISPFSTSDPRLFSPT